MAALPKHWEGGSLHLAIISCHCFISGDDDFELAETNGSFEVFLHRSLRRNSRQKSPQALLLFPLLIAHLTTGRGKREEMSGGKGGGRKGGGKEGEKEKGGGRERERRRKEGFMYLLSSVVVDKSTHSIWQ